MEIFIGEKMRNEALSENDGQSCLEEMNGDDSGSVVVTKKTVVEKTEVERVYDVKDDEFMKNEEQEVKVDDKGGLLSDLFDYDVDDGGMDVVCSENDDFETLVKPGLEETVDGDSGSVTTTLVEKTEVSVVEMVQDNEFMKEQEHEVKVNVKEGLFADLFNYDVDDGGMNIICSENDDSQTILKPSLQETFGEELGSVVVMTTKTKTKTEVSVVEMVQDDKDDAFMKNQEQEVKVNKTEGLFVDLFNYDDDSHGDDDGMNVICSENDDSEIIVKPSLEEIVSDDLGSVVDATTLVEKTKISAVEAIQDSKDEFMKNQGQEGMVSEKDEIMVNLFDETDKNEETTVEIREDNASELVENKEEHGEQSEGEEETNHGFAVGDIVWGKNKSQTWWPGQVYDPSCESDDAPILKQKGQLLVAYFGDGSFSWCSPSQLKPFVDHFPEMSNLSDNEMFVNAVQMALAEVSKLLEVGLLCKCQAVNRVDSSGVTVPKGNTVKVMMDQMQPLKLLATLEASAIMVPGTGPAEIEIALLKSCLNAFYSKNGGYMLVKYHEPTFIKGLEDKTTSVVAVVADSDINVPSESTDNSDDKLHQTRKKKSVAELTREDEPKLKKTKRSAGGASGKRKRKALLVSVTPESDHESVGDVGVEEENMSSRRRKKSKYLSPPYLSPEEGRRLSVLSSASFKEPKSEPEKVPEMAAKHLEEFLESREKRTRQKKGSPDGSDSQEEQKKKFDAAFNVNKAFQGLLGVALDPTSYVLENLPVVTDFFSSYRSSYLEEGSSYQTDQKKHAGETSSDLAFVKQKLESMIEIVQRCEECELRADIKASLEAGMQEILQKVGKMKGK